MAAGRTSPPGRCPRSNRRVSGAEDALAIGSPNGVAMSVTAVPEATRLFADWSAWTRAAGESVGSQKRFSQALQAKGYKKDESARHATFVGIALNSPRPWTETDDERA